MIVYDVLVPEFAEADRVQFTATVSSVLMNFTGEWWEDKWHLSILREGEKRVCDVNPNILHFQSDPTWRLAIVSDKSIIDYNDLSGLKLQVAVSD